MWLTGNFFRGPLEAYNANGDAGMVSVEIQANFNTIRKYQDDLIANIQDKKAQEQKRKNHDKFDPTATDKQLKRLRDHIAHHKIERDKNLHKLPFGVGPRIIPQRDKSCQQPPYRQIHGVSRPLEQLNQYQACDRP